MTFYHGTNRIIGKIDLAKSRNRVDFGKGFYLTDKFGTARDWALRKVELEGEGIPTVLRYEVEQDIFQMHGYRFPESPNQEWLDFICSNRRVAVSGTASREPRHLYNWVSGPIADDKVVDVVAEYMREDITGGKAIKRLKALPRTFQLSLHTAEAVGYVDDENVHFMQFKEGHWSQKWHNR